MSLPGLVVLRLCLLTGYTVSRILSPLRGWLCRYSSHGEIQSRTSREELEADLESAGFRVELCGAEGELGYAAGIVE